MSPARKPAAEHQSWDEFWAEVSGGRTEVIRGVRVRVPTDMPLLMEQRVEELRDSEAEEDLHELVGLLFSGNVLGQWIEAGMGVVEFQTALTWGMAHAGGADMSFHEALELVRSGDGEGKKQGPKGPNRAARRAAPAKRSAAGGGPSKRTSSANTGSARRTSRG
ncbi:hypothetical protein ACIQAC_01245 [Streptomyces sp. NPDC088387]|uniref:hypothetical protein n=1 Tax=Streptomyces sp. NPDC088387 TaxID=3365859 RepID=UPI003823C53F